MSRVFLLALAEGGFFAKGPVVKFRGEGEEAGGAASMRQERPSLGRLLWLPKIDTVIVPRIPFTVALLFFFLSIFPRAGPAEQRGGGGGGEGEGSGGGRRRGRSEIRLGTRPERIGRAVYGVLLLSWI